MSKNAFRGYRNRSLTLIASAVLLVIVLAASANSQATGTANNHFWGTWIHNVELFPGGTAPALVTIHSDGTMSVSSSFMFGMPGMPIRMSPIHTVWEKTGPKSIAATSIFFVFDADGVMTGYQRNRCTLTASDDFNSYTGKEYMDTLACPAGAFSCPDPTDPAAVWVPNQGMPAGGYPASARRLQPQLPPAE